jgi:tRNA dimethylallyltransferase
MLGVPHFLLDVTDPKKRFSIVKYKELALKEISEILKRGHLPIICGGTGFYISAVVDNVTFPDVPPNKKLRLSLNKKTPEELYEKLLQLDPKRAEKIDRKNSRRLVRAIEIATALGKVPPATEAPEFDCLQIGLNPSSEELKSKISVRLLARIETGMIAEAQKLHEQGLSWKRMIELGLEYRFLALFLQKKISKMEMISRLQTEIWHYAKRQMTWFRADKRIRWFQLEEQDKIEKTVEEFLRK